MSRSIVRSLKIYPVIVLSLLLLDVALTAPLQSQVCGGDNQKPCFRWDVKTPCAECNSQGGCSLTGCTYVQEYCRSSYSVVIGGLCRTKSRYDVPRPEPVSFTDGGRPVTAGFQVRIDLKEAWVVIPNLTTSNICTGTSLTPNALRKIVPDTNAPTQPVWPTDPYYSMLAINGSFFDVTAYDRNKSIHDKPCTFVYGYTLSNKALVRPEEEIKVYRHDGPPRDVTPATLVFYTEAYRGQSGKYAEIKKYPMFTSNPGQVPENYQNAISGIPLVKDGKYVPSFPQADCRLPRTAVGLTQDSRYLIAVVVNPGTNNGECESSIGGTTLASLAEYIVSLGAYNAINLDGGGSSQLYYRSNPIVQTMPSDLRYGLYPNLRFYRPVGNFLGFR
ncbi:MAG: phosphodiester glycosidase family protein [bacterium]|nr:phosphodiester glycosidase family protein [bacterium]